MVAIALFLAEGGAVHRRLAQGPVLGLGQSTHHLLADLLPGPDEVDSVTGTRSGLFALILVATLLLGMAEVLRDNSNQTIMPNIVKPHQLEKANGRIWSIEGVMQTFVGPPLGSILLLTEEGIYAGRDRLGRTPLIIGEKDGSYCVTVETSSSMTLPS